MRRLMSVLCWLVAAVLAFVAVPASWMGSHVTDSSGFTTLTAHVIDSAQVRSEAADLVATKVSASTGLGTEVTGTVLDRTFTRAASSTGLRSAWEETLRRTHARLLDDDDSSAASGVQVDVQPLAAYAIGQLSLTGAQLPGSMWVDVGASRPDGATIDLINALPGIGWIASIGALVAAAACVLFARRRGTAVIVLGLSLMAVAGVWRVVARSGADWAVDRYAPNESSALLGSLVDRVADVFTSDLIRVAIAGAIVTVVGLVWRGAGAARRR